MAVASRALAWREGRRRRGGKWLEFEGVEVRREEGVGLLGNGNSQALLVELEGG